MIGIGSGKVEGTKGDFPGEVHCIPEFGIVETEGHHVLPHFLNMSGVSCESLEA